jgi:hypothetical protein
LELEIFGTIASSAIEQTLSFERVEKPRDTMRLDHEALTEFARGDKFSLPEASTPRGRTAAPSH